MTNIVCTTDPISLQPLVVNKRYPKVKDCRGPYCLTVFFENKKNRRMFMAIPMHKKVLIPSNMTDEWIDEG